jgi:hypothetical protein
VAVICHTRGGPREVPNASEHNVEPGSPSRTRNYQMFGPLDAEERLLRELLRDDANAWFGEEVHRYRLLGKRQISRLLLAPALLAALTVVIWAGGDPVAASAACALLFGFLWLVTPPADRAI